MTNKLEHSVKAALKTASNEEKEELKEVIELKNQIEKRNQIKEVFLQCLNSILEKFNSLNELGFAVLFEELGKHRGRQIQ